MGVKMTIFICKKADSMNDELVEIFKKLKVLLTKYSKQMASKNDTDSRFDLWSEKDVIIAGKKKSEMYFAEASIKSDYVGFYFMPIYLAPDELKKVLEPELLKLLKGKSCFHIKHLDDKLLMQIGDALKIGYQMYKQKGWV